jgi:hypothetical protein
LALLRLALDRALSVHPDARFASLFVDAPGPPDPRALMSLRARLDETGRLDPAAEITWHGRPGPAAIALGATRLSLPRPPASWPSGPFALDLGPRDPSVTKRTTPGCGIWRRPAWSIWASAAGACRPSPCGGWMS